MGPLPKAGGEGEPLEEIGGLRRAVDDKPHGHALEAANRAGAVKRDHRECVTRRVVEIQPGPEISRDDSAPHFTVQAAQAIGNSGNAGARDRFDAQRGRAA